MALPKLEKDIEYISKLPDQPNDVGGLSAAELKAEFDKAARDIKEYINTVLLPLLESASGAGEIGIETISGISEAQDVQAALEALKLAIDNTATGAIPDSSLEGVKFVPGAVGTRELADNAVTDPKIAGLSGTKVTEKTLPGTALEDESLDSHHYKPLSIQTKHLADEIVDSGKVKPYSLAAINYAPGSVSTPAIANGAATRAKLAQDALYSPIENLDSINITSEHMGETLTNPWSRAAIYTLTQTNSANMPKGAELAIYRSGQNASTTVTIVSSGVRFVVCGNVSILDSGTTLTIPDFFGMVALKKISLADSNGGDVWLVTGNVEVVS